MTKTTRPKAFSYLRFSTPEQMQGDSRRRQTDLATLYAAKHGLDLDITSFQDLGVSAFRGANVRTGALSMFNRYVEDGTIPEGSYLLLESLDRLTRGDIVSAQGLLMQIIGAGITVVTLQPGNERVYSLESLDRNPTEIIIAIVELMRAHGESATKSSRLKEAWKAKRSVLASKPLTSIAPAWVAMRPDRSGFDLLEDRAQVVRNIFVRYLDGVGQQSIATALNEGGVPPFRDGSHWRRSYISKILANPAVVGTFTPHTENSRSGRTIRVPEEPVENYYPAVVDRDTFMAAQSMRSKTAGAAARPRTKGVRHLLAGLAKCPLCGSTMTRVTKGSKKKAGLPYLACVQAKAGVGCQYKTVKVADVEAALVSHIGIIAATAPSGLTDLDEQLEKAQNERDGIEDAQERLVEALSKGDAPAIRKRLDRLQVDLDEVAARITALTTEIVTKGSVFVAKGVEELELELSRDDLNIPKANAAMRRVLDGVTVDYRSGHLELEWKQGGFTPVLFAWPLGDGT